MNKLKLYFEGPVDTLSGYGHHARDLVRSLIEMDKYDIKVISTKWGSTPLGGLDPNDPKDKMVIDRIINKIEEKPDIFMQVTVPTAFNPIGKYNIGITAGIETTIASAKWIEGCNRMNLVLVPSTHSKNVFEYSQYNINDNNGNVTGMLKLNVPCEVLIEGVDTEVFKKTTKISKSIKKYLDSIEEDFAYLYVGHWLNGDLGQDRKNTGMLIKTFFDAFYNYEKKKPALILKTSVGTLSITDRDMVIDKINKIQRMYPDISKLPNIYLLHGDLSKEEMNSLYNHSKIGAMVNLTKGEGYGRPMLEFATIGKPVIASGWSGQLEFLNKTDHHLVPGKLEKIHSSAVWEDVLIPESSWFECDYEHVAKVLYLHYDQPKQLNLTKNAKNAMGRLRNNFSLEKMTSKFENILDRYIPEFPSEVKLELPKLKKIDLPKLQSNG